MRNRANQIARVGILLAVIVILFAVFSGGEVRVHSHQYHPAPATATPVECVYDTCPYQPYYHEHEGYPRHKHEYKGEYQTKGKGIDF
jgi:hypothetical protein